LWAQARRAKADSCETKFDLSAGRFPPSLKIRGQVALPSLLSLSQSRRGGDAIGDGKLEQCRPVAVIILKPKMIAYD
jgi:hypothetical protein